MTKNIVYLRECQKVFIRNIFLVFFICRRGGGQGGTLILIPFRLMSTKTYREHVTFIRKITTFLIDGRDGLIFR